MAEISWQAVAALIDPVRRALYDYVRGQDHPVTREESAHALAISRSLCAFHLDKLVDVRLLRAHYQAPADQPRGRGRTPKVYLPAESELSLTIPRRRYEIIGDILAQAVAADPTNAAKAAADLAFEHGRRFGQNHRPSGGRPLTRAEALHATRTALTDLGFEPCPDDSAGLTLRNCPFSGLASHQPELVCALNHSFIAGLLVAIEAQDLIAELQPTPGACCVTVHPA